MATVGGIRIGAVVIALFAFYVVPFLPLVVVTSVPNFLAADPKSQTSALYSVSLIALWFLAIGPVGSGYLAAKLAGRMPLYHGLITGLAGAALVAIAVQGGILFSKVILPLIVVSSGLFGAWLWKDGNPAPLTTEIVFEDGVGYDSAKLLRSIAGRCLLSQNQYVRQPAPACAPLTLPNHTESGLSSVVMSQPYHRFLLSPRRSAQYTSNGALPAARQLGA